MMLESLSKDLFIPMEMDESASVLGGVYAAEVAGETFRNTYTFFTDGTYDAEDRDQDKTAPAEPPMA
jgi:hypothetical protein